MAKAQWLASDGTVGNAPTGLTNLLTADGQSLSDWQIVSEAGASGGKAVKLTSVTSLRRYLVIPGVTADETVRTDVRVRWYSTHETNSGLNVIIVRADGTGASDSTSGYFRIGTTRVPQLNRQSPTNTLLQSGTAYGTGDIPGWFQARLTFDPALATEWRVAIWAEAGAGSDSSPDVTLSHAVLESTITGDRIGFGAFAATDDLIDWITVGTGADDADAAPASGGPTLSAATGTATGTTTATIGATTDTATGTLYGFVSTSATPPTAANLKSGTGAAWSGSVAVSSTGAKTLSATGLTAGTGYYAHLIHTDGSANDSNIVTSAQFTTLSLTKKLRVGNLSANAIGATSITGIVWAAQASAIAGAEIGEFAGGSIVSDGAGGAKLEIAVSEFGGASLTTSDTPKVLIRGSTGGVAHTTGIIDATVFEE